MAVENEGFAYRRQGKILPRGGLRQNIGGLSASICLNYGAELWRARCICRVRGRRFFQTNFR
jgi:hypothetical protein